MKKFVLILPIVAVIFTSCQKQPTSCFTTSSDIVDVDEEITFSDCSENAKIYEWDFGDGSTSSESSPKHSYSSSGDYSVVLNTTSKNGKKTAEQSTNVSVNTTPTEKIMKKWAVVTFTGDGANQLYTEYSDNMTCTSGATVYYTSTYSSDMNFTFTNTTLTIVNNYSNVTLDYTNSYDFCSDYYDYDSGVDTDQSAWEFSPSFDRVIQTYSDGTSNTWNVDELTDTSMTWSMTQSGINYLVVFELF